MRKKTVTIAFRADTDLLRLIDAECEKFGVSRGSWVRGIVITWLHQIDRSQDQSSTFSVEEVKKIQDELGQLRLDFAKSNYLLLTTLGELSDEQARQLVRQQFIR